jgi:hypothetical protein
LIGFSSSDTGYASASGSDRGTDDPDVPESPYYEEGYEDMSIMGRILAIFGYTRNDIVRTQSYYL